QERKDQLHSWSFFVVFFSYSQKKVTHVRGALWGILVLKSCPDGNTALSDGNKVTLDGINSRNSR
ncbi:hypothetical protein, partial [Peribacillus psychrosaccharolyticus]|uniref:hypothetical protein n=1 Tax=Peribacillus psychrosaccharolyticus TaxID=1407 RepID=UPI001F16D316